MRIALVSGICIAHDAISNIVVEQIDMLGSLPDVTDVHLFTHHCDRPIAAGHTVVQEPWDLLTDPRLLGADLVVFHWGIAYPLFGALVALAPRVRTAVHFHNTTPSALLTGTDRSKAEETIRQALLLAELPTEVWTYSNFNRRTLLDWGVSEHRIHDLPFAVTRPPLGAPRRRHDGLDMMTIGRFVPAKGLHVLIDAVALLDPPVRTGLVLHLVGNQHVSDPEYLAQIRSRIRAHGLDAHVEFHDGISAAELWTMYERAHMVISPSFHEGFCVPIVEGYLSGCRAVVTDAGNLPDLVIPPDPVVPAGDAEALAAAITRVGAEIEAGRWHRRSTIQQHTARYDPVRVRERLAQRIRGVGPSAGRGDHSTRHVGRSVTSPSVS